MRHEDHKGNRGELGPGSIQWMTAGRGIIHSEMPLQKDGLLWGFQLWVNLPARSKMIEPRYQDIPASAIPNVATEDGVVIRVIAGEARGTRGPVEGIVTSPLYLDVLVPEGGTYEHAIPPDHNVLVYVFEGAGEVGGERVGARELAVMSRDGEKSVRLTASEGPMRALLLAAKPLEEPLARYGPFVMNTRAEIERAFEDYRRGTLLGEQAAEK
jgi:redox-sensitive bicupin YhaK (pirin superfamily)